MENVEGQEQMPADRFLDTLEMIQGLPGTNTSPEKKVSTLTALERSIQAEWEVRHFRKSEYKSLMSAVTSAIRVVQNGGGAVVAPTASAVEAPVGGAMGAAVRAQKPAARSHGACESRLGWLTREMFALGRMSHERAGIKAEDLLSAISQMEVDRQVCKVHGTEMLTTLGAKVKVILAKGEDGCQRRIQWAREQAEGFRRLPTSEAFESAVGVVREVFRMIATGVVCRDHSERVVVFLGSLMSSLHHRYAREESIKAATKVWNNLQQSKTFKEIVSSIKKASELFASGTLLKGHLQRLEADARDRRVNLQTKLNNRRSVGSRNRKSTGLSVRLENLQTGSSTN